MEINYEINESGVITGYTSFPLDKSKPTLKVREIYTGFSYIKDGEFHLNKKGYINNLKLKITKAQILKWFIDNDWRVNKRVLGEWSEDDERWKAYLAERKLKREQLDVIEASIKNI